MESCDTNTNKMITMALFREHKLNRTLIINNN